MKIKSITIEGFHNVDKKVYNFENNITYITGPNGSGKSTILQAIQLALLGYIPGTNKTNKAIFRHANNHTIAVTLELLDEDIPIQIRRIWTGTKSSVTSKLETIPENYPIEDVIGKLELPIFNFNEFVGMTANSLKDWFINFLPDEEIELDWRTILKEAANKAEIKICDDEMISTALECLEGKDLKGVESVRSLNDGLKAGLSFAKSEVSRMEATIGSLIYYDDYQETLSSEEIRSKVSELQDKKNLITFRRSVEAENARIDAAIAELDLTCKSIQEDLGFRELQDKYTRIKAECTDLEYKKSDVKDRRLSIIQDINSINTIIHSKGICPYTSTECPTISKEVGYSQKTKLDREMDLSRVDSELAGIEEQIQTLVSEQADISAQIANMQDKYRQKEFLMNHYTHDLPDTSQYPSLEEIDRELKQYADWLIKVSANERYNAMIDKLTAEKFKLEQKVSLYKIWIELTSVNGLQTSIQAVNPFDRLASTIDERLQATFGNSVHAKFNLESKSNSFSFGMERDDAYIPYDLLSSGEKCLYMLALIMALIDASDTSLKLVIVDDLLDHLDDANIIKLFESLYVVKDIQFIFAGVKTVESANLENYVVEIAKNPEI